MSLSDENSSAFQTPNTTIESPFPSSFQFVREEPGISEQVEEYSSFTESDTPFPSIYELENPLESQGIVAPEMEEYVTFLNELYDEEFNEVIAELVDEATELYQDQFESEYGDPIVQKREAEYLLESHFEPLSFEIEAFIEGLASELEELDLERLHEAEIENFIDQYEPTIEGGIFSKIRKVGKKIKMAAKKAKKKFKGVAKKIVRKAKKGIKTVGKGIRKAGKFIKKKIVGVLRKLKKLIKPLLKKVLTTALNRLPPQYRQLAKTLASRLFKKEIEELEELEQGDNTTQNLVAIQSEFDEQIANLLFREEEAEMDAVISEYITESQQPITEDATDILDRARAKFIDQVTELEDGEDPTPVLENFIPAILPALRLGLRLIGRQKVVGFLAKYLAKLVRKFVGKKYAPLLSQAIVDVGLRLIGLEVTPEDEAQAAGAAVAATVEETVRQVATLPEYILDNQELLEGFVLEAFEKAAAANLPQVLSQKSYENRPELRETSRMPGTWVLSPLRGRRKRYKKYSRIPEVTVTPEIARTVKTFCGVPLAVFLRDRLGLVPGRPFKARIHLYEAIPGTMLSQICKGETYVPGLGTSEARSQLHPLTPEAAGMLLGQAGLGRDVSPRYLDHQPTTAVGQRLYYLEIPGAYPKVMPTPEGESVARRASEVSVTFDFPADQLRSSIFLSEADAQSIAVRLRQRVPMGMVVALLHSVLEPKLKTALSGQFAGHVKIIHGAVTPEYARGPALRLLPQVVTERLTQQVMDWLGLFLSNHLKQHSQDFLAATEDFADGVTLRVRLNHPPGLSTLGRAFRGEPVSLYSFNFSDGMPDANIQVSAGFYRE
ncbi:hypothetical protein [Coleofasciculus sp. F4-SAH-05]|uniref:hypothetical protein n=1 Tax=Coleofasciculus sp. F4-SAH-05 TaxID=3069525 RepID=UPI0032F198AD